MVQKTGNIKDIKRYLVPHYFGCLTKFAKAIGHNELTAEDIIFARDCPVKKYGEISSTKIIKQIDLINNTMMIHYRS